MVKIKVTYNNNTIDYDLNRDSPLPTTISGLCTTLGVTDNANDCMLQNTATFYYITQAVRAKERYNSCNSRTTRIGPLVSIEVGDSARFGGS